MVNGDQIVCRNHQRNGKTNDLPTDDLNLKKIKRVIRSYRKEKEKCKVFFQCIEHGKQAVQVHSEARLLRSPKNQKITIEQMH